MKAYKFILLLAVVFCTSSMVSAQKFGYINSQELIQQLPEVKEANSNIEAYQSQLQRKGQEMIQSLQTKYETIEKNRANYSPVQLEAEAQKLKDEENKIIEFEQSSQQKILEKSEMLLQPIREKIQNAIDAVAKENGYTYVFDYSMGFVLYADSSTNIGSMVKAKLGL
jgi:outer membrane protein